MKHAGASSDDQRVCPPSVVELFAIFARIGLTSFGGGLSGWFMREFVHRRGWLSEEDFLNGLALSQALPGVNVSNMAIWIGYRMRGTAGALASVVGVIAPSAVLIVVLGALMSALTKDETAHWALDGAAAAAIGLSLTMGITAARRVPRKLLPIGLMVTTFALIAFLHVPLVWVVLVGSPLSIGLAYLTAGRD